MDASARKSPLCKQKAASFRGTKRAALGQLGVTGGHMDQGPPLPLTALCCLKLLSGCKARAHCLAMQKKKKKKKRLTIMDVFFDTPPRTRRLSGGFFFPTCGRVGIRNRALKFFFFFCFSPKIIIILLDKDLLLGGFMSAI